MSNPYVQWLHSGEVTRELGGGKASSLSRLIAAGFPVPAGFCVTAAGFRRFAVAERVAERLAPLLAALELSDRAATRSVIARVQETIAVCGLPDDLSSAICEAYEQLRREYGHAVAVRSSATSEDGTASSFAGLLDTFLNVAGLEAVIEAVQRCYASMWSERVLGYYARRGSEPSGAMAVVVMEMIPAEISGVVFTAHPVTGDLDQVVINATWGLGDAIVSGAVTPDSYVFAKETLALLERETSAKAIGIFPATSGLGVVEAELDAGRATAASLDEDAAREVARVACRIESYFGGPQDIEFAIASGGLYVLQSRPITTL